MIFCFYIVVFTEILVTIHSAILSLPNIIHICCYKLVEIRRITRVGLNDLDMAINLARSPTTASVNNRDRAHESLSTNLACRNSRMFSSNGISWNRVRDWLILECYVILSTYTREYHTFWLPPRTKSAEIWKRNTTIDKDSRPIQLHYSWLRRGANW